MQLAIMVRNNTLESIVQKKFGLDSTMAVGRYKNILLQKRICKTVAEVEAKYLDSQPGLWKDGEVVVAKGSPFHWGRKDLRRLLIINLPGPPLYKLYQPKTEQDSVWKLERLVARSQYRFPYWNYLTEAELVEVRDWSVMYQPFRHSFFALSELEET